MILITSAAYLVDEFISEVGFLPPSFLPIGNKRLYEYQIELLKKFDEDIYLSYPESYHINEYDMKKLTDASVTVIPVPDGLSLGNSILYCWNKVITKENTLSILHGDTFFLEIDLRKNNSITIHDNKGFYKRGAINNNNFLSQFISDKQKVISGFFSFSNAKEFITYLSHGDDFISSLSKYNIQNILDYNESGIWLDFGHINSFFQARSKVTTQRAFNALKVEKRYVLKSSVDNNKKIQAEANWFQNIPQELKLYTPHLLDVKKSSPYSYKLEYLYLLPVSDLVVFCDLNHNHLKSIFSACYEVLNEFKKYKPETLYINDNNDLYISKTEARLRTYANQINYDIYNKKLKYNNVNVGSLLDIAHHANQFINSVKIDDIGILHGDLCFSNILFDSRTQAVKLIDPRGMSNTGKLSIYGDTRYDLAKLNHSFVGLYDFIIAGCYDLENNDNNYYISFYNIEKIESYYTMYRNTFFSKTNEKEILAITIHLFLSMLPMHYDRPDRQQAFIANALRLYTKLIN